MIDVYNNIMNHLVTIIIPVYNVEERIAHCLDSVIAQTYHNIEILLIDDGSTDNSGNICDRYSQKDSRIRVFHKKNGGVSSARNTGIFQAKGDYICFVDSDDAVKSDMIQEMLDKAIEYNADISCCLLEVIDIDGTIKPSSSGICGVFNNKDIISVFFSDQFIKDQMYGPYNKLYKSELLRGKQFRPYKLGEDILFVFEVLLRSKRIYISNKVGYQYLRRTGSAMTSAFSEKKLDYIYAAIEVVELCKKYAHYANDAASNWLFYHYLITLRQILINNQRMNLQTFYNQGLTYIKKHNGFLKNYGIIRKLDYIGIVYIPLYFKLLKPIFYKNVRTIK